MSKRELSCYAEKNSFTLYHTIPHFLLQKYCTKDKCNHTEREKNRHKAQNILPQNIPDKCSFA